MEINCKKSIAARFKRPSTGMEIACDVPVEKTWLTVAIFGLIILMFAFHTTWSFRVWRWVSGEILKCLKTLRSRFVCLRSDAWPHSTVTTGIFITCLVGNYNKPSLLLGGGAGWASQFVRIKTMDLLTNRRPNQVIRESYNKPWSTPQPIAPSQLRKGSTYSQQNTEYCRMSSILISSPIWHVELPKGHTVSPTHLFPLLKHA